MRKTLISLAALALVASPVSLAAQSDEAEEPAPSPGQIVDQASADEWIGIAASDLLVMDLAPDAEDNERRVIIQLMPEPFSQGWIRNIRKLAEAKWWDGTSINRVQDNYVVQWGGFTEEGAEEKPLPEGLETVPESEYTSIGIPGILSPVAGPDAFSERQVSIFFNAFRIAGRNPDFLEAEFKDRAIEQSANDFLGILKDRYSDISLIAEGWPVAGTVDLEQRDSLFWPVHCYGMVGVGRNLSPDTGSGAELYTVIGHAPRHLDRNIALVGRIIDGMEHLSSLPRGKGALGFYEDPAKRVPITSIRLANALPTAEQPRFEYLDTEGVSFARYAEARANRRDPFFNVPAGGADICNIPVPVRRAAE